MSRRPQGPFIGGLLRDAWQVVRARIDADVRAAGFDDIGQAHLSLFRWRGMDGMRPTEVAHQAWISKQAANDLLRDLEDWGYIRREVDPVDKRSRIIRLTARGRQLHRTALTAAREAERALERQLGTRRFRSLERTLHEIRNGVGGTANSDGGGPSKRTRVPGGPAPRRGPANAHGAAQTSRTSTGTRDM